LPSKYTKFIQDAPQRNHLFLHLVGKYVPKFCKSYKKMKKLYLPTFLMSLLVSLFFQACSSGKKSLQRGDYYNASLQAIERLRSSPNNAKAQQTLSQSYWMALEDLLRQTRTADVNSNPLNWEQIANSYYKINRLDREIRTAPAALKIIPDPKSYITEENQARQKAAEARYQAGKKAMQLNTRESGKQAYEHFLKADSWVNGYKDIAQLLPEAKMMATLKVLMQPIGVPNNFAPTTDFFQNRMRTFLEDYRRGNEFVMFFTPQEAQQSGICCPDQYLVMNFDEFSVGNMVNNNYTTTLKDSVKKVVNNLSVTEFVQADFTRHEQILISKGIMDLRVIDAKTNRVLMQDKIGSEFQWKHEWASFKGDARALKAEQSKLLQQKAAQPPTPQDLFVGFCDPIFNRATERLRQFYRSF
jgi:tetratricopeptide (TPR) repeat protein